MPFEDYSATPSANTNLAGTYIGPNMYRNDVRPAFQQLAADGKLLSTTVANIALAVGPDAALNLGKLIGRDLGQINGGNQNDLEVTRKFSGAASGTTTYYGEVRYVMAEGINNLDIVRNNYNGTFLDTSGGNTNVASGLHQFVWLRGSGTASYAKAIEGHLRVDATSITGSAEIFRVSGTTLGATAFVEELTGFSCGDVSISSKVNLARCFHAEDQAAANLFTAAFHSEMTTGTNKWNLYSDGTCRSAHKGRFKIGATTDPGYSLDVTSNDENFSAAVTNSNGANPYGLRIVFSAAAPSDTTHEFIRCEDLGTTRFSVKSNGQVFIDGNRVVAARQTGTAANATDLATAIALVNDLKAKLVAHGLIS